MPVGKILNSGFKEVVFISPPFKVKIPSITV
jgi:hypothetical protein